MNEREDSDEKSKSEPKDHPNTLAWIKTTSLLNKIMEKPDTPVTPIQEELSNKEDLSSTEEDMPEGKALGLFILFLIGLFISILIYQFDVIYLKDETFRDFFNRKFVTEPENISKEMDDSRQKNKKHYQLID